MEYESKDVAKAAVMVALTGGRDDENAQKRTCKNAGIAVCAVDFGGVFVDIIGKIVERAVVSAKREGLISDTHVEIGAVAGATGDAVSQLSSRALGYSVGGKVGIARHEHHIAVAVYMGLGLIHLNDVALGLAHRVV